MEKLTHWKKNNDSRYISGEDLYNGISLGKGLKPEMVVSIESFEDSETFDQNNQSKVVKTGFILKDEETGKKIYKPVILNNTNGDFCEKEFASKFMEHWIGKPFVLYAKPDKRHGHVARFKKHYPIQLKKMTAEQLTKAVEAVKAGTTTLEAIKKHYELTAEQEKMFV